jgi:hypothetical protein
MLNWSVEVLREHKGNGNGQDRLCLFRTLIPEHHPHMRCSFYPFEWTVVCTVAGFCFQALTAWISWIGTLSKLYQVCWEAENEVTERELWWLPDKMTTSERVISSSSWNAPFGLLKGNEKRKLRHVNPDMLRPPFSEPDDLLQPQKGQQENINWFPYRF